MKNSKGQFESTHDYELKLNVCNHYVVNGGNSKSAERTTGVDASTIRRWTKTQWWEDMVTEVRKHHQSRLDGKFTAAIDKIYNEISDRITEGDEVLWAKTGEMLRKKMSGKDLTLMLSVLIDKRALMRGDPTSRVEKMTIEKQMKTLQEQLEERTRANREKIEASENVEEIKTA